MADSDRSRSTPFESFTTPLTGRGRDVPVDVEDRGDEYLVTADLPGLRKQDIGVKVRKKTLQITATPESDTSEGVTIRRERPRQEAVRTIRLPEAVDEGRTTARYQDGVLELTLHKRG